jgi:hypothetical protein
MHTFSRTVTYTRVTRWPSFSACSGGLAASSGQKAVSAVWGCASSGITPPSLVRGMARDLNHDPYFDTQATLPTTVPIAHGRHPTHRPRRPAAQPAGEDDRSRSPFRHSWCFRALPVLPCSCFHTHHTHVFHCIVVSLYLIPLVSPFLHSSCFHMLVLPVLPHARACIPITLTLLYRCVVVSRCLLVSLCRCISLSPCNVVSLYLVVSF